jgi:LCP family protein required for cell wall assembly
MFSKNTKRSLGASALGEGGKKRHTGRIIGIVIAVVLIASGALAYFKLDSLAGKISFGNTSLLGNIVKSLPGVEKGLKGEETGRINVLLLGMRGEGVAGGGLLADTIMVLSIHPSVGKEGEPGYQPKASLVSIPRDFWVQVPGREEHRKINAVYALGRERSETGGMEDMRTIVGTITGLDIPYAITLNFQGFKDLVNAVGGVTVHLDQPFVEGVQFRGLEQRCDLVKYTIPSGKIEVKKGVRRNGAVYYRHYDLCFEKITPAVMGELECGGDFKLPVGDTLLDGDKALCYARSRDATSDFARARRQQDIINLIRAKALSLGTLTDYSKVDAVLGSLGKNVRTDMEVWELKRLYELYKKIGESVPLTQKVLEDSEEGMLYAPEVNAERGYVLLPRGENYNRIQEFFRSIP